MGPPYVALFERGRTWSLPIETTTGGEVARGTLSCSVAEVKQVGDASVARLACAAPYAALLVGGQWVATPAGLYHPLLPIDDADELALLGDDDLLIAAQPEAREHSRALAGAEDSTAAFAHDRGWCVHAATATRDDRREYTLCFDARGITGGSELVTGSAGTQRVRFGNAPEPDDTAQDDD